MTALLFWAAFLVAGVGMQYFLPGLDVMASGLLVSLQREPLSRTLWLVLALILVQEGVSSLAFGTALAAYAALIGAYFWGRVVFEPASLLFVLLLGLFHAAFVALLPYVLAGLEGIVLPPRDWLGVFAFQSLVFMAGWVVTFSLHLRFVRLAPRAV